MININKSMTYLDNLIEKDNGYGYIYNDFGYCGYVSPAKISARVRILQKMDFHSIYGCLLVI